MTYEQLAARAFSGMVDIATMDIGSIGYATKDRRPAGRFTVVAVRDQTKAERREMPYVGRVADVRFDDGGYEETILGMVTL